MKIIHVTDELQPEAGGLISVPINLAAAQAEAGHEVVLIGRTGSEQLRASGETKKIPGFSRVRMLDAQAPGRAAKILPLKAYSVLKAEISNDSIVHLHGVWDPILMLASRLAEKQHARYMVTPHSMLHPWQMRRYVWQKKVVFGIGWRRMFDRAAFVHALNAAEAQYVAAFDFKSPIEIIPNGIYPETPPPNGQNKFLEQFPQYRTTPYILFLARLHHQKGLVHLLDGFAEFARSHPEVHLVLAGPDYGERSVIEKKIAGWPCASRIALPGPLYGEEKEGALRAATCFALTSLNEGFSVALLEALSYGLPVVISEHCYFPEVATAEAGLIPDLSPSAIAGALASIFDQPALKTRMGENARSLVQTNYHWKAIAQKTILLYQAHAAHTV